MTLKSPAETMQLLKERCNPIWKKTFLTAFLVGLANHLPMMVRDIPNHDGLASMYFDQNMITSGRWFLTVACGFSSYFTIPWLIGLLGILFLSLTAVVLTELLEIRETWAACLTGALLLVFPSLCTTFCYVFTLDGYMLAVLLSVLAVFVTKRYPKGFFAGAVLLSFSLGTYQAYLPFAMLLSLYCVLQGEETLSEKGRKAIRYVLMGGIGLALYYILLKILLWIQGKTLSGYQGIGGTGDAAKPSLAETILRMYRDFPAFTIRGNVFTGNLFSKLAMLGLLLLFVWTLGKQAVIKKWYVRGWFWLCFAAAVLFLPPLSNIMLLLSPGVNYHLLMRYHYVLLPIFALAVLSKSKGETQKPHRKGDIKMTGSENGIAWLTLLCASVLVFTYALADQIAYSNLEKKYEKTYSYCLRLLDRIEQTPGYYQGIPIAMIGVVGEESYPVTDLTGEVTAGMIGMSGDSLLYTGENYESFIRNYLGASLNILPAEAMQEAYYEPFYREMQSFPAPDSIRIVDGILYIKTENKE